MTQNDLNPKDFNPVEAVANQAYAHLDEHNITTFTHGNNLVAWEPDFATLTIVNLATGNVALSAVKDGDGWQDHGSNVSPDMVGDFNRLAVQQQPQPQSQPQPQPQKKTKQVEL